MSKITEDNQQDKLASGSKKLIGKRESKRIELLDEAAKVLNRKGISQTSLRAIAKNVGVSRSALYYYVDDQQDLVFQCYLRTCEQLLGLLEVSGTKNNNALDIIDSFFASVMSEDMPEFASISDISFLREEQQSVVLGLYKGIRSSLADVIKKGIDKKEVRSCSPIITASVILGMITWVPVALRWYSSTKGDNFFAFCNTIRETLKIGIAKDRKEIKQFNKFDLSSFFSESINVFDSNDRIAARRDALVRVASWLFNQKGVEATSLEEIASHVGVTKKVIYHNVGGKDQLVAECYRRALSFFKFVYSLTNSFDGSRLDAVCTNLTTLAAASTRKDVAMLVPITGHDVWSDDIQQEIFDSINSLTATNINSYLEGIKESSIRKVDAQAVVLLRPGLYEWMARWGHSLSEKELEQAPDEITNIFRLGLTPL